MEVLSEIGVAGPSVNKRQTPAPTDGFDVLSWELCHKQSHIPHNGDEESGKMYRCEAASIEGFIQQLAVSYVGQGYWFYVSGRVPDRKDPRAVDAKLMTRYGVDISKWARARRKVGGLANVHYIRYDRFWVLLATKGVHRFFRDEPNFKDIRDKPLKFEGYSISYKRGADGKWHPSIRLHPDRYRELKAYFLDLAAHRSGERLAIEFVALRLVPYAPIRRQLLDTLRAVNRARNAAGFAPLPTSVLRLRKWVIRPFAAADDRGAA